MSKTICDWSKKDLEKKQDLLMELTKDPCFFCRKCGRVANNSKALCKAKKFAQEQEKDNILPFSKSA